MRDEVDAIHAWVQKAEEDLLLAQLALAQAPSLIYGATFHAQQCAEKYLKAILLSHGRNPPRIHDLVALSDICRSAGATIPVDDDLLAMLNQFATQVRYPGDDPTQTDAEHAVHIAQSLRNAARNLLGLD